MPTTPELRERSADREPPPSPTGVPARELPNALWFAVHDALRKHGLNAPALEVMLAVGRLINRTPVSDGGRLLPDGTVDPA